MSSIVLTANFSVATGDAWRMGMGAFSRVPRKFYDTTSRIMNNKFYHIYMFVEKWGSVRSRNSCRTYSSVSYSYVLLYIHTREMTETCTTQMLRVFCFRELILFHYLIFFHDSGMSSYVRI